MAYPIAVPDIGDFSGVEVLEVLVKTGDTVARDDPLITLESDKATMDVPSPQAGVIAAVKVKPGDKVSQGDIIAEIEPADEKSQTAASPTAAQTPANNPPATAEATNAKPATANPTTAAAETKPATADAPAAADSADSPPASDKSAETPVAVPDIGDFSGVEVLEVLVKTGDTVARDAPLITLESDKATMDVPSPAAGVVSKIAVKVGDKVSQGDAILYLTAAESAAAKPAAAESVAESAAKQSGDSSGDKPTATGASRQADSAIAPPASPPSAAAVVSPPQKPAADSPVYASPAVRRVAREFGVDLSAVAGSGRKGRILKEDVQAFVRERLSKPATTAAAAAEAAMPEIDFSQFGEIEQKPRSRINKLSAMNIARNWRAAPQVTQCIDADISGMESFRQTLAADNDKRGYKVTPLAFLMKAAAAALVAFPDFNASLAADGEHLIVKKYRHIGFAADTKQGLVVPVLRDADKKGILQIAAELAELSARAREGKLKREEMQGGCFTISSLGGIGGTYFTPILNLPEAAILGVSRARTVPHWNGKEFIPRLTLPLSLTYDHRIIDGAAGARFAVYLADILADIRRLAL